MSQSNLPKSRLNQIARRKLVQLGIPSSIAREQDDLEAQIPSTQGRLKNPFNQQPIAHLRFRVEGHAHAVFIDPLVLTSLPPIRFYECTSSIELLDAISSALRTRAEMLGRLSQKLSTIGLSFRVDTDRGVLVSRIELNPSLGAILLEGDASAIFAVEVISRAAGKTRIPRVQIDFEWLADRTHLELALSRIAEEALKPVAREAPPVPKISPTEVRAAEARPTVARSAVVADTGELVLELSSADLPKEPRPKIVGTPAEHPQAPSSLSLGLLVEKLGDHALVGAGVSVLRELKVGDRTARFEAKQIEGLTFAGRVIIDGQVRWQERFAFDTFPGIEKFLADLLGVGQVRDDGRAASPRAGEIWSMRVVVERDEADEIRYVGLSSGGQPYGAPRILPRAQFTDAFHEHGGGYRMLVRVIGASVDSVQYVRLDAKKNPVEQLKTVPYLGFIGQFVRD